MVQHRFWIPQDRLQRALLPIEGMPFTLPGSVIGRYRWRIGVDAERLVGDRIRLSGRITHEKEQGQPASQSIELGIGWQF